MAKIGLPSKKGDDTEGQKNKKKRARKKESRWGVEIRTKGSNN